MTQSADTTSPASAPPRPWLANYAHASPWASTFEPCPVADLLRLSAERTPQAPYLDFLGREYSYEEVWQQVLQAASGFQTLGVKKGIKVGLFLPNCPQYVIAYYGILLAGGTVVNFSPLYSAEELTAQVEDSQTDIMVCLDVLSLYRTIAQVLSQSRLRCLVVGSLADVLPAGKALLYRMFKRRERATIKPDLRHIRFDSLLDNTGKPRPVEIDPAKDIALLQYTGGTTGTPKGAVLTHANLSINAQQVAAIETQMGHQPDRMFGALPFFHVFANTSILNVTTLVGQEIVMLPKFELNQALATLARKKVTILPGVPTMYTALLDYKRIDRFDLSSVRLCISGGAPMPAELKKRFETKTGAVVVEGYGLTETSGVASVNPVAGVNKPGSIGLPLPGTDIVIVDRDDPSRPVPPGEAGEITLAGPQVMQGYWRRENGEDVFVNGRLRTGDVGYIDADGYTFIIDRVKDMLMVGGFKVYPRHIEDALYAHPMVREAAVIGIPDSYLGERPKAFVTLIDGADPAPDGQALLAYLKQHVGKHELPVAVEIRTDLPKTMIGKLSKKDLREQEAAARQQSAA